MTLKTTSQAAEYIHSSASFLEKLRCYNPQKSPKFIKMGRKVFYRTEDLDEYIASCEVGGQNDE